MARKHDESKREGRVITQWRLIARLKDSDQAGWEEFWSIYTPLIHGVALKSGCTKDEAEEVVQETLISVSKEMPAFNPDPIHGAFSSWLLKITHRRIIDQLRKRPPVGRFASMSLPSTDTPPVNRIPDSDAGIDDSWEADHRKQLLKRAIERLKTKVRPAHFRIFYLAVVKEQSVREVAKALGVSAPQVYLVRHRLSQALKRETKALERVAGVIGIPKLPNRNAREGNLSTKSRQHT